MMPRRSTQRTQALTLVEVVVLLACVTLLAVLFLAPLHASQHYAQRITCVNNLKQIGLAFRVWSPDQTDRYPMAVSITNGGAREFIATGNVAETFLCMSNQLATPRILHCPADPNTTMADNFTNGFSRINISYFVSPDAAEDYPQMILSGDDNLMVNGKPVQPGTLNIPTNDAVEWTSERHVNCGNIGLADGSAQQVTILGLQTALSNAAVAMTNTFNRFAIP